MKEIAMEMIVNGFVKFFFSLYSQNQRQSYSLYIYRIWACRWTLLV